MNADQRNEMHAWLSERAWVRATPWAEENDDLIRFMDAVQALFDAYDQTTANLTATQAHATALLERARAAEAVLAELPGPAGWADPMSDDTYVSAVVKMGTVRRAARLLAARGTGQTPMAHGGEVEKLRADVARLTAQRNVLQGDVTAVSGFLGAGQTESVAVAASRVRQERDAARADLARLESRHRDLCLSELRVVAELAAEKQKTQALEAELREERGRAWEMAMLAEWKDESATNNHEVIRRLAVHAGQMITRLSWLEDELREERGKAWRAWREVALVEPLISTMGRHIAELIEGRLGGGRWLPTSRWPTCGTRRKRCWTALAIPATA